MIYGYKKKGYFERNKKQTSTSEKLQNKIIQSGKVHNNTKYRTNDVVQVMNKRIKDTIRAVEIEYWRRC